MTANLPSPSSSPPEKPDPSIKARIFKPILEKYAQDEISTLLQNEQFHAMRGALKVVGSEDLGQITAADRNELEARIKELIERHQPAPLLIKLDATTLDNTYIIDKRYRHQDPEAIGEIVYFSYDERGKKISKFYGDEVKEANKEMQQNLAMHGWTMGDYYYALYAGMPANKITRNEIKENLKRLEPFEQDAIQKIRDLQQASFNRIGEKIFRVFGIRVKTTFDEKDEEEFRRNGNKRWLRSVYNTAAERKKKDEINAGRPMHLVSYLNRYCVHEMGRIIRKERDNRLSGDPVDYFRKFHPEMMTLSFADNNMLGDNEDEQDYAL
ncbi:hypothetical protein [Candidatus Nitrososphaera evergladensis]|nr:hypothetical protein [Candidatus Nitrososphaera evergladensis]